MQSIKQLDVAPSVLSYSFGQPLTTVVLLQTSYHSVQMCRCAEPQRAIQLMSTRISCKSDPVCFDTQAGRRSTTAMRAKILDCGACCMTDLIKH